MVSTFLNPLPVEIWEVKPEYSREWLYMTRMEMLSFLNWTKYKCEVKNHE